MNFRDPHPIPDTSAPIVDPSHELPPEPAAEVTLEALGEQIRQLEAERDSLRDRLLRAAADADNARKRGLRELQEARLRATTDAVRPFLAVLDGFERAAAHVSAEDVQALRTGFDLLHRQLQEAARSAGLQAIEAVDQPFDPHLHQALEMVDTDRVPDGTVVEQLQRGYQLQGRLVRPAMVKVARAKS